MYNNASFQPGYMARALRRAVQDKAGLVFVPCHPSLGWQGMSPTDIAAERDVLAYPAGPTGLPLLGITIVVDGYWSARLWENRCIKVPVVGQDNFGGLHR